MSEENKIEQTSVEIGKDVSGSGIVSGNNNVTNVTHITNITQLPPKEEEPKTVPTNPRPKFVSKMCDRNPQTDDFIDYFQDNCKNYPGRPQIYLLHGEIEERHDSFIERIRHKELRKLWKDDIYYSDDRIPAWPESGNSEKRKQRLIRNLVGEFSGRVTSDFSATDFSRLPNFGLTSLVIIWHNIDAFKWDKRHETDMILWYRDYWSKLECNEKTPLFLIFLNIGYRKDSKVSLREKMCFWNYCSPKNIESRLAEIAAVQNENCPCSLISKLEPVDEFHVREWLKVHARTLEHKWEDIISEIFSSKSSKVSMNIIEATLLKLLDEQDKLLAWK
jgi:hypothetical protein